MNVLDDLSFRILALLFGVFFTPLELGGTTISTFFLLSGVTDIIL